MSRAKKGLSSRKVVRNYLRPHLRIPYAVTVPAYAWRFQYFAYAPAYADLRISEFYLRRHSYDHLPSYHMKGGVYSVAQMEILAKTQELNFLPSSTQVSIGQLLTTFADNFGFRCLECHLVGKEFHVSSCNIFRGTTAFWQGQHNVESLSSSGIVALLLAVRIPKGFRDAASHRAVLSSMFSMGAGGASAKRSEKDSAAQPKLQNFNLHWPMLHSWKFKLEFSPRLKN